MTKQDNSVDFCVISHNCWGAEVYRELKLAYNTPFVGLFVPSTCFIKLLSNTDHWLHEPLTFTKHSKYSFYNDFRERRSDFYPIGVLGGEIEIHFLHYADNEEALKKWTRRLARMPSNLDQWYCEFSYREVFNENEISAFDQLPFKNKVFFSHKKIEGINSLVCLTELSKAKEVFDGKALYNISKYYFNAKNWVLKKPSSPSLFKAFIGKIRILKTL